MKIFVCGPKGVGKTSFIQKMFPDDEIKQYIVKSNEPCPIDEEIVQSYMILPEFNDAQEKYGLTENKYEEWVRFYEDHCKKYNMMWVSKF